MAIILNNIKTLVGGSGVSLPSLANPGTKEDLMLNKELIDGNGNKVTGTMPNNGAISKTMDGLNTKSVSIPKGYTSGGTVSLTNDIDNIADTQSSKIAQIKTALEGKAAGGGGGETVTITLTFGYDQGTTVTGNVKRYNPKVISVHYVDNTGSYVSSEYFAKTGTAAPSNITLTITVIKGAMVALSTLSGTTFTTDGHCAVYDSGADAFLVPSSNTAVTT